MNPAADPILLEVAFPPVIVQGYPAFVSMTLRNGSDTEVSELAVSLRWTGFEGGQIYWAAEGTLKPGMRVSSGLVGFTPGRGGIMMVRCSIDLVCGAKPLRISDRPGGGVAEEISILARPGNSRAEQTILEEITRTYRRWGQGVWSSLPEALLSIPPGPGRRAELHWLPDDLTLMMKTPHHPAPGVRRGRLGEKISPDGSFSSTSKRRESVSVPEPVSPEADQQEFSGRAAPSPPGPRPPAGMPPGTTVPVPGVIHPGVRETSRTVVPPVPPPVTPKGPKWIPLPGHSPPPPTPGSRRRKRNAWAGRAVACAVVVLGLIIIREAFYSPESGSRNGTAQYNIAPEPQPQPLIPDPPKDKPIPILDIVKTPDQEKKTLLPQSSTPGTILESQPPRQETLQTVSDDSETSAVAKTTTAPPPESETKPLPAPISGPDVAAEKVIQEEKIRTFVREWYRHWSQPGARSAERVTRRDFTGDPEPTEIIPKQEMQAREEKYYADHGGNRIENVILEGPTPVIMRGGTFSATTTFIHRHLISATSQMENLEVTEELHMESDTGGGLKVHAVNRLNRLNLNEEVLKFITSYVRTGNSSKASGGIPLDERMQYWLKDATYLELHGIAAIRTKLAEVQRQNSFRSYTIQKMRRISAKDSRSWSAEFDLESRTGPSRTTAPPATTRFAMEIVRLDGKFFLTSLTMPPP